MLLRRLLNIRIGARLALTFGALIALTLGLAAIEGYLGLSYMRDLNQRAENIYSRELLTIKKLGTVKTGISRVHVHALEHLVTSAPSHMDSLAGNIENAQERIREEIEQFQAGAETPVERKLIHTYASLAQSYLTRIHNEILPLSLSGKKTEAASLLRGAASADFRRIHEILDDLADYYANSAQTRYQYAVVDYDTALSVLPEIILAIFILSVPISFFVTRSIVRPLKAAVAIADRVANGDLTSAIKVQTKDETGQMLRALQGMNDNLKQLISKVHLGAKSIITVTQQLTAGNTTLAQRATERSSALEETATTMETITATVKQNSEHCVQANVVASNSRDSAQKGAAVMTDVVKTMRMINESSKKVVDIVGVINDIAFQTNILAVNAAIEAARAGEHGRGFAVVATEVRNLARRCADAANEINTLVSDSLGNISSGEKLVDDARSAMDDIVANATQVNDFISDIASASMAQSTSVEQANKAIIHMDEDTQQDAMLVDEVTAAARLLEEQVNILNEAVNLFRLNETDETDRAADAVNESAQSDAAPEGQITATGDDTRRVTAVNKVSAIKLGPGAWDANGIWRPHQASGKAF